jgi:hypothetical protein
LRRRRCEEQNTADEKPPFDPRRLREEQAGQGAGPLGRSSSLLSATTIFSVAAVGYVTM